MEQRNSRPLDGQQMVSLAVFEANMMMADKRDRRHWISMILVIILFVASNAWWIWRETQFVEESIVIEQDSDDGNNNYIGNDGDIVNWPTP